ncbi:Trans-aconitate 2-methyltransferase [Pseudodesulfovibrio hydrargyri]|uniref:Trans-aconitate 2-methyltransferase n=1 Tax=Pseudodesulfovibrio hydrargyri TaxID=2125990 RepID=A0A1J5N7I3_9BACT|nr:class I SAM-dependent methyltransferase [Pseudodesulfovibrio hydrargyri]OIQ49263.1 Trans-aconitate 2-methyltransferase [Pseudodesulfovibrio hydrargyri]
MITRVYIPMDEYVDLLPAILEAGIPNHKARPRPVLDLCGLRCMFLTFEGVDAYVRTPFAFPFVISVLRGEFRQPMHRLEEVDWLYLGGDKAGFVSALAEHARATGEEAELIPFRELSGAVPQQPREGEFHVTIPRNTVNYNENSWVKNKDVLSGVPPESWGRKTANNTGSYARLIERLAVPHLPRPPRVIVDLGSGLGYTTAELARLHPEARVFGLELSDSALEVARASFDEPNLTFLKHDISEPLDFGEGAIDLLVSVNALAYARDQKRSADDIFAKLSPDGIFFNHSRIGYSHDFWEFPYSLVWPLIFQIYPETWAGAASERGLNTRMLPPQLSRRLTPWSFMHPMSQGTMRALERCSLRYQEEDVAEYLPCTTHALLLHSRHVEDNMESHLSGGPSRGETLAHCLGLLSEMPDYMQDMALRSRRENAKSMGLGDVGMDYCRRFVAGGVAF